MLLDATQGSESMAMDAEDGPEAMSGIESAVSPSATPSTGTNEISELVYTAHGLFPQPYQPGACPKKVLSLFDMLGQAIAKCLQDSRLLDLQLAPSFLRAMLGHPLNMFDLEHIDPSLAASLFKLKHAISVRSSHLSLIL